MIYKIRKPEFSTSFLCCKTATSCQNTSRNAIWSPNPQFLTIQLITHLLFFLCVQKLNSYLVYKNSLKTATNFKLVWIPTSQTLFDKFPKTPTNKNYNMTLLPLPSILFLLTSLPFSVISQLDERPTLLNLKRSLGDPRLSAYGTTHLPRATGRRLPASPETSPG